MKHIYIALAFMLSSCLYGIESSNLVKEATDAVKAIIMADDLNELYTFIAQGQRSGANGSTIDQIKNVEQLTTALGFTSTELAAQEQQLAQQTFERFWSRYKQVLIPLGITLVSLAAIITNAIALKNQIANNTQPHGVASFVTGSLGYSIFQSVCAMVGASYKTVVQIKKGYYDHRQKKVVAKLKNAQLLLTMLQKQVTNPDGTINPILAAEIQKEQAEIAHLTIEADQATIDAENADVLAEAIKTAQDSAA